jgi:hypothetical protein
MLVNEVQIVEKEYSLINVADSDGVGEAFGKVPDAHTKPSGFQFHSLRITQARPALRGISCFP